MKPIRCLHRLATALFVGVWLLGLSGCPLSSAASGTDLSPDSNVASATSSALVTVDLWSEATPAKLRQGFLHGVPDAPVAAGSLAAIDALAPGFWRLSNLYNGAAYSLVTRNGFPARHGTRIQWNLNDVFSQTYGFPVVIDPACDPNVGPKCLRSFDALKSAWASFIESFMLRIQADGVIVDDFDIFSEPDVFWKGLSSPEQFYELFKIAHDIVRKHRPAARIVAPSTSKAPTDGFRPFFDYLAANGLRLDAVAWHEFDRPGVVGAHVASVRQAMAAAYLAQPQLAPTEIQIDEYAPPQAQLIPGWTVAWLAEFERAGVDAAARACWNLGSGWSGCERGLDGVLLADQVTPQPLYWVHWAYARMPTARVAVTAPAEGFAVIASKDAASAEVRLLVGRAGCGATGRWCVGGDLPAANDATAAIDVAVRVDGYRAATSVRVTRMRLPGASQPTALTAPEMLPAQTVPVASGVVQVTLPLLDDGGAFVVVISPAP